MLWYACGSQRVIFTVGQCLPATLFETAPPCLFVCVPGKLFWGSSGLHLPLIPHEHEDCKCGVNTSSHSSMASASLMELSPHSYYIYSKKRNQMMIFRGGILQDYVFSF